MFFNYRDVGVQSLFDDSQKKSLYYNDPKKMYANEKSAAKNTYMKVKTYSVAFKKHSENS